MDEILKDARFAHIAKDPKFRRIPKAERKVKIDKRFQGMFKDKKFSVKYTVDKRGRPVNQTSTENLKKYYDISSSEDDSKVEASNTVVDKNQKKKKSKKKKGKVNTNDKANNDDDGGEQSTEESDNCFSSNGELFRIKPKSKDDDDEEDDTQSEGTEIDVASEEKKLNADLVENEKQLHLRVKNENTKLTNEVKERLKDLSVNYARGEGVLLTDSSSDEESSEYSEEEEEIEHDWGELDRDAETTEEITHRLALCNMDWDRIRAADLMILFYSFLPRGGLIHSITIYPSEFGLKRMKEEEISGPIELTQVQENVDDLNHEDDNEEGSEYHMEKLRQYQLNRLKYYYAVIVFDSPETANKIYTECEGIEYESTATKLDLRFIPNDMTFDQAPKEVCKEIPELSKYQPRQFTTTALQQVKVELTWDETNPERQELTQKLNCGKLDELNENDIQAYLASGTSDSDSETNEKERKSLEDKIEEDNTNSDPIDKYKALLKAIEEKEEEKQNKDVELEFTWGLGVKEKTEKLMKEKTKKEEQLTPFEQYLEKRKAKKKARKEERKKSQQDDEGSSTNDENVEDSDVDASENNRKVKSSSRKKVANAKNSNMDASDEESEKQRLAELELLLMDENNVENKQHFNMKKIEENATLSKSKQKRLKKKNQQDNIKEDDFEVNVKDSRFAALFTSHHFNIDPADPHYRKTKGTEALVNEKLKRRANDVTNEIQTKQPKKDTKLNTELQSLVKSVKRKAQNISQPIK